MRLLLCRCASVVPLLAGCATLTRLGGASAGALGGAALAGPAGAAAGAAGGFLLAETTVDSVPAAQPETVWGLLGKLLDQAIWLAFVAALLWLLAWAAPSPKELFGRALNRWRGTS